MKRFTSLLLLVAVALVALAANPTIAANPDDKIWRANNTVNGVELKAKYKESPENGLLDQTLEVQLDNAPGNVTVLISINGQVIGEMTTDSAGTAHFRLDKLGVRPGPDGRPTGRRINTGDVIRVFKGGSGISASFVQTQ